MLFPSADWIEAWVDRCNADEQFRINGEGWDGSAGYVIKPEPRFALSTQYIRLTGRDGHWDEAILGSDPGLTEGALFVLSAGYSTWAAVIRQELHPIKAIVQGKVRHH